MSVEPGLIETTLRKGRMRRAKVDREREWVRLEAAEKERGDEAKARYDAFLQTERIYSSSSMDRNAREQYDKAGVAYLWWTWKGVFGKLGPRAVTRVREGES
jgi:hypothetical protein